MTTVCLFRGKLFLNRIAGPPIATEVTFDCNMGDIG